MLWIAFGLSGLSLIIWLVLLLAWGNFWRCDQRLASLDDNAAASFGLADQPSPAQPTASKRDRLPNVTTIVPARNEAEVIATALASLLGQTYPGLQSVILVDDQSDDGTAAIAQQTAQQITQTTAQQLAQEISYGTPAPSAKLTILTGQPLPAGWSGKLWAMNQGVVAAQQQNPQPDYLWLTDADIEHDRHSLAQLVAKAEREGLAMASLMVQLRCESFWERFLIPAFIFFFQKLYPFPWVNNPKRSIAGAAGGCILIRRDVLEQIGGLEILRQALIDDCSLAAAVKGDRTRNIWLGLGPETLSLRAYETLDSIWNMVARTAYTQLRYSPFLLVGTLIGMTLVYLIAPIGLIYGLLQGNWLLAAINAVTWGLMAIAYWPTIKLYQQPLGYAFGLPLIATLYAAMTFDSAWRHWQGKGGAWKGRVYQN